MLTKEQEDKAQERLIKCIEDGVEHDYTATPARWQTVDEEGVAIHYTAMMCKVCRQLKMVKAA